MDDDPKSRFIDVSKGDVDELIAKKENQNTKKKTMHDLNIVLKFLREDEKERIRENLTGGAECLPYLVNSLLQLERRKETNMSRFLSEESYQALTVILQGANMVEGYSLIPNLRDWETHQSKAKRTEKTRQKK